MKVNHTKIKRALPLLIIMAVSILLYLWFSYCHNFNIGFFDDSGSYFMAGEVFMRGEIDFFRTPVYPLICHFAAYLSANNALLLIVLLQECMFLVSIVAFYLCLSTFSIGKKTSLFATAIYAWCPIFFGYNNLIFTESLAISFSTLFLCAVAMLLTGKRPLAASISSILLMFVMVMLRPFFICFTPVLAIALISALIKYRSNKRLIVATCSTGIIAAAAVVAYCCAYQKAYNQFGFSSVYELNRNMAMASMGFCPDNHYICYYKYVSQPDINGNRYTAKIAWRWNPTEQYRERCNQIYEQNKTQYIKNKIFEFVYSLRMEYVSSITKSTWGYYISRHLNVSLAQICLFILLFTAIELLHFRWRNSISIMSLCLVSLCIATIFTSIWGADCQYLRLMMPMTPCLFVMVAILLNRFTCTIVKPQIK
ncbi:MAG: hypothetical protein ACI308_05580 [Muribaculaceae bacterium]